MRCWLHYKGNILYISVSAALFLKHIYDLPTVSYLSYLTCKIRENAINEQLEHNWDGSGSSDQFVSWNITKNFRRFKETILQHIYIMYMHMYNVYMCMYIYINTSEKCTFWCAVTQFPVAQRKRWLSDKTKAGTWELPAIPQISYTVLSTSVNPPVFQYSPK